MFGEFPKEFADGQVKYLYLDMERKKTEFLPGIEVPLRPFPGTIGLARAEPGQYSTVPPGRYAGNLDIRELTEGTALYIPVFVKGGLLWSGDSHAGQGNGEVNLTAIETAFKELNLTLEVIKGKPLDWPRIETRTHWLSIGYDQDLDKALELLKAETAKLIAEQRRQKPAEAEATMRKLWDCRIAEVVNVVKGTYCMNPKKLDAPLPAALPKAETGSDLVTYAKDASLAKAMDAASMAMIELLQKQKKLARLDAYGLASVAMDCRIGPPVGSDKEVHCLVPKSLWVGRARKKS
jgi:acetamidase/formamidase